MPRPRRHAFVEHLLGYCDRLVVGVHNEVQGTRQLEGEVASWGFDVVGRSERPHPHPQLAYRVFWVDAK